MRKSKEGKYCPHSVAEEAVLQAVRRCAPVQTSVVRWVDPQVTVKGEKGRFSHGVAALLI